MHSSPETVTDRQAALPSPPNCSHIGRTVRSCRATCSRPGGADRRAARLGAGNCCESAAGLGTAAVSGWPRARAWVSTGRSRGRGGPGSRRQGSSGAVSSTPQGARLSRDRPVPISLSAIGTPGGIPSCTTTTLVPSPASTRVVVIVISPRSVGSEVSNSSTSTTCSFGSTV